MGIVRWFRYAIGQGPDIEVIRHFEKISNEVEKWEVRVDGESVFNLDVWGDGSFIVSTSQSMKDRKGGMTW